MYVSFYQIDELQIRIQATDEGILSISGLFEPSFEEEVENVWTKAAKTQLEEYFQGIRQTFDLPLIMQGTYFQNSVWRSLQAIPFGETVSYQDVAGAIGNAKACQAVGTAVGKNPFFIVVPCHRVISANGSIGGFALGLNVKRKLLKQEGIVLKNEKEEHCK